MTTVLALIGVAWIGCAIAAAAMWHHYAWPGDPTCQCGKWDLDPDTGITLPMVDHHLIHDHQLCCPVAEVIVHPEDRPSTNPTRPNDTSKNDDK